MAPIVEQLQRRIQEQGPLPFRDYMEEVLRFYYASPRNPIGMDGDFYTSADLDPIFGQLLADQFQKWAAEFDRFTIVELGAGKGLLAQAILERHRFDYLILEQSPAMRQRQQALLKDYAVTWIDALPAGITGCIFSNEFFDALPVHRVVCRGGAFKEIYVGEGFREVEAEPQPAVAAYIERNALRFSDGQMTEINLDALDWIRRISASLLRGYHLAIDYGYLRDEFHAQRRGTLMCYREHHAVEDPYTHIGEQDMTAHVNFSDLMEAPSLETIEFVKQRDYLVQLGILDEMQRLAIAGDAASMHRLLRIKKLILPGTMGDRFKVLVQTKK